MSTVLLQLNFFEVGYLTASLKDDCWDNMPRALWLKLHILTSKAYLGHPQLGKQARSDIQKWEKELYEIEGQGGDNNGSKKS